MAEVNMPKLSDTMEEGTVLEWKKKSGDTVKKGEVLAEIESDKASFEIEADSEGVLQIVVDTGKPVPVGDLIARIGGAGTTPGPAAGPTPEPGAEKTPEPAAEPSPEPAPQPAPEQKQPAAAQPSRAADGVRASPIARRLAEEMGVDLATITGTGPEGRIVKEDVLAAGKASRPAPAPAAPAPQPPRPTEASVFEEPTRMQATIARRMTESKTTVPHFYITVEARVDEAVRMRTQLKETVPGADTVTMTDMLVRACAIALTRHPQVNASWADGRFERKRNINIGLAVPPASGLGLLVPVIHDADRMDLIQVSVEARQVIERARSGRAAQGDLEGGTFSISNLGMYGVDEFSAIVNPPEAAILAVGAIKDAPVVEDGDVRVGKVMRMTLSVDHRVFYGAPAAQFLAEVKRLIENPVSLLVPPEA